MGAIIILISGETTAGSPPLTQSFCLTLLLFLRLWHHRLASFHFVHLFNALPHLNEPSEWHVFCWGRKTLKYPNEPCSCLGPIRGNNMHNFVMKQVDFWKRNEIFYDVLTQGERMPWWKLCPLVHCGFHPHAIHTWFRVCGRSGIPSVTRAINELL